MIKGHLKERTTHFKAQAIGQSSAEARVISRPTPQAASLETTVDFTVEVRYPLVVRQLLVLTCDYRVNNTCTLAGTLRLVMTAASSLLVRKLADRSCKQSTLQ